MSEDFLTQEEAAELAGVTIQTLIAWRKMKGLRYFKIVGKIRYKPKDILEFIEPKEATNEPESL